MALTARQQAFVDAYSGNGTEAAREAGYQGDAKALAIQASKLLKMAKVAQGIEARRTRFEALAAQGSQGRAPEVAKVAKVVDQGFAKVDQAVVKRIATRVDRQAFWTEVLQDPDVSMSDRLRASELLGKSEGDYLEKVEHSGLTVTLENPYAGKPGP